jgi:hypothetical protein
VHRQALGPPVFRSQALEQSVLEALSKGVSSKKRQEETMTLNTGLRKSRSHHHRWSVDWNLMMWGFALVVTLTILMMHLASQIPARSPSVTNAAVDDGSSLR